jgi:selenocysteine-specific elongation factor
VIVGTAGHIDHGKSSLMQALTGVHTDRLPEEKRRGISIELGYAFLELSDGRKLSFVDVPGHEKLIHTMVAGATGMNHALLLVAADDGVMPQTVEHFSILNLLSVPSILIVVTKIDLVDQARLNEVEQQISQLIENTRFQNAVRHAVSSRTGEGIEQLRQSLSLLEAPEAAHPTTGFRMAIDRSFTLNGVGTVVAGSVLGGCVDVESEVAVIDSTQIRTARVRGLHAQNVKVSKAGRMDRCAMNLAGLSKEECPRGGWVVDPFIVQQSQRVDVSMCLWRGEDKPLRSGSWVHLHAGTSSCLATVAVLQSSVPDQLQPGEAGIVQLVFKQTLSMWWGDRFLVRDASASRTLGGGFVLDPQAPARYRKTPKRLAILDTLSETEPALRLKSLISQHEYGVSLDEWLVRNAMSRAPGELWLSGLNKEQDFCWIGRAGDRLGWAISPEALRKLWELVHAQLSLLHQKYPEELGPDLGRLRRISAPKLDMPLWQALVTQWVSEGCLHRKGAHLHLPEHAFRLSESDRRISEKAAALLHDGKFDPPWVRDVAASINEPELMVRVVFSRLASQGQLHQVVKDLFYPHATMQMLADIVRDLGESEGEIQAARFRDMTGLGRKRAIQILEYFDRVGLLRRSRDRHLLRRDTVLFCPDTEAVST